MCYHVIEDDGMDNTKTVLLMIPVRELNKLMENPDWGLRTHSFSITRF